MRQEGDVMACPKEGCDYHAVIVEIPAFHVRTLAPAPPVKAAPAAAAPPASNDCSFGVTRGR